MKYQVFKCDSPPSFGDELYEIRTAYYDENYEIDGWTATPSLPRSSSIEDLRNILVEMLDACDDTILDERRLKPTVEQEVYHNDAVFNRYDILDAYYSYYWRYMDDNQRTGRDKQHSKKRTIIAILNRNGYIPLPWTVFQNMSENSKKIYDNLVYTYENVT